MKTPTKPNKNYASEKVCKTDSKDGIVSSEISKDAFQDQYYKGGIGGFLPPQGDDNTAKPKRPLEDFPNPTADPVTPEFIKRTYFDKLPSKAVTKQEILIFFKTIGLQGTGLEMAANTAIKSDQDYLCHGAWSLIPLFSIEKERRAKISKKWSYASHYQTYWKLWATHGLLYRDQMREYDDFLVRALQTWCTRNNKIADDYLPPKKSKRIDDNLHDAEYSTQVEIEQAVRVKKLRESRENNR